MDNHADWLACEYDGKALVDDYLAATPGQDESLPQVHAIYVHPAKTNSRFLQFAAMFQADALQSSAQYICPSGVATGTSPDCTKLNTDPGY